MLHLNAGSENQRPNLEGHDRQYSHEEVLQSAAQSPVGDLGSLQDCWTRRLETRHLRYLHLDRETGIPGKSELVTLVRFTCSRGLTCKGDCRAVSRSC